MPNREDPSDRREVGDTTYVGPAGTAQDAGNLLADQIGGADRGRPSSRRMWSPVRGNTRRGAYLKGDQVSATRVWTPPELISVKSNAALASHFVLAGQIAPTPAVSV